MDFPFGEDDLNFDRTKFEHFLSWLKSYQLEYDIVAKIVSKFFQCRQCWHADECTIVTLNRAAEKIYAGASVKSKPLSYIKGFAKNVLHEYGRNSKRVINIEALKNQLRTEIEHNFKTQVEGCLERCFNQPEAKKLYRYKVNKKERRQIAKELNMTLESLRVWAHRIKKKLLICQNKCLQLT